jgi:tRNA U55 pseudouridine synthase TruB
MYTRRIEDSTSSEMRHEVGCGVGEYVRSCAVFLGDKRCPVSHAVRVRKSLSKVSQNYS